MKLNKSKSFKFSINDLFFSFVFSELINRRHYSKSESLLVSLLKQEAIIEKKQDVPMDKISSSNNKIDYDDDDIIINTDNIQVKLDKKDPDFNMKKQKNSKKTTINKNQVFIYDKIILFFLSYELFFIIMVNSFCPWNSSYFLSRFN